jgi:Zn-dependent protease
MSNWWVNDTLQVVGPIYLISWVMWVILSITLHELAHGWVAIRCGDDVPYHSGHMTWNPFVHIPFPWAWIMFVMFGFTWGLMPTNPANYRRRYDESRVAFAGPAMNLSLAVLCVFADGFWLKFGDRTGVSAEMMKNVHLFLYTGVLINVVGFVFNLLPFPPLDGSRILSDFVPAYRRIWESEAGQIAGFIGFALLFFVVSKYVWGAGHYLSAWATVIFADAIGAPLMSPF